MDFVLGIKLFKKIGNIYFMNLGFPFYNADETKNKFNFISQLKKKNIIESYDWFIYFEKGMDRNKDEIIKLETFDNLKLTLIIGGPPHYFNNNLFYKSQLLKSYTEEYGWFIKFKDIYLIFDKNTEKERKIKEYDTDVEIYLDELLIYAPPFFTSYLMREFFSKYSSCHEEKWEDIFIYCDKSDNFNISDLKKFPSFYFQHIDFNYTFELTFQDLFFEYNGKYYFLVTDNEDENWRIGYPFLKKYQFVFNQDSKTIGFFYPNLPKEKEKDDKEIDDGREDKNNKTNNDNNDNINKNETNNEVNNRTNNKISNKSNNISIKTAITIMVIFIFVFIVAGLIIGKIAFKKKTKRRVNEFDENYDYCISNDFDGKIN